MSILSNIFGTTVKSVINRLPHLEVMDNFFSFSFGVGNSKKFLEAYESNPYVYMVVNKIASTSSSLPIVNVNGEESKIIDLLSNPNTKQSQSEFLKEVEENYLLTGNCIILIDRLGFGLGEQLIVLNFGRCKPRFNNKINTGWDYTNEHGVVVFYPNKDIIHIKMSNVVYIDKYSFETGLSPLKASWSIVVSSNEKLKAEASIFKNKGIIGVLTNKSNKPMLKTERERLQGEFDEEVGGADKFNKIKISTSDLNYIQTGMSPTDLKLIEGLISSKRDICAIYGMPSALFNDPENSQYANMSEAKKTSYEDVYVPCLNAILEKITMRLNRELMVNEDIKVDIKLVSNVSATTNETAQTLNDLDDNLQEAIISSLTYNELRDIVGVDTIEGGDVIRLPKQNNKQDEQ